MSGDTLCNYLCVENTNPFTLNFIHTGMDENQLQSKVNKSSNKVVSSIVNIFLCTGYEKVYVLLNFCPWCKHHFPVVLSII